MARATCAASFRAASASVVWSISAVDRSSAVSAALRAAPANAEPVDVLPALAEPPSLPVWRREGRVPWASGLITRAGCESVRAVSLADDAPDTSASLPLFATRPFRFAAASPAGGTTTTILLLRGRRTFRNRRPRASSLRRRRITTHAATQQPPPKMRLMPTTRVAAKAALSNAAAAASMTDSDAPLTPDSVSLSECAGPND